jgi:NADH-quinone oxidoreductase subunit N
VFLTQFSFLKAADPILAILFAFLVFSRSGIPPLGGFFIKLDILSVLFSNSHFFINYVLFILSVFSFFYYLRVIKIIFFDVKNTTHTSSVIAHNSYFSSDIPRFEGRV